MLHHLRHKLHSVNFPDTLLGLVAERAPDKERIVLRPLLADGTLVTIEASRADVLAYRSGALSAPEFLSTLQVTDDAATVATPEGIREAGTQSPAAAPGGAADRKAGLPLGLWLGIIMLISAAAGVLVWQLGKRRWASTAAVVPAGGQQCPQCGAELAPGGTFCSVCGAPRRQLPAHFAEAERRFAALPARYQAGELDDAAYRAELQGLVVQDQAGDYWTPGGEAGEWHSYDGRQWVPRDPPLVQPPRA